MKAGTVKVGLVVLALAAVRCTGAFAGTSVEASAKLIMENNPGVTKERAYEFASSERGRALQAASDQLQKKIWASNDGTTIRILQ